MKFKRRRRAHTAAPPSGEDPRWEGEHLYDGMMLAADALRSACRAVVPQRLVAALQWPWVMTAGGRIAEPAAPDSEVLAQALALLGEGDVTPLVSEFVRAEHELCARGLGIPARSDEAREAFVSRIPPLPETPPDLSYAPYDRIMERAAELVADLNVEMRGVRSVDVERLAGSVRWWPGRDLRSDARSVDPLALRSWMRALDEQPGLGNWVPAWDRLMKLQLGEEPVEPVEPERWILAAFARRSSAVGGLHKNGDG